MRFRLFVMGILCLALMACGGGGGSNSGNIGDSGGDSGGGENGGGTNPPPVTSAASTVLAFNDLGMHCMDREFSVFSILPPFNVVHSQVVLRDADGKPYLADETEVDVSYDAVTDPSGSRNSYSAGVAKTDFWLYADSLFGVNLTAGEGLTGLYMPDDDPLNRGAQPMDYSASAGWFSAEGIPITPVDDNLATNTYSLLQVAAHDKSSGSKIGSLDVVVPVATETDCQACHKTGGIAATGQGWANDADLEVQAKKNILRLHDLNRPVYNLENNTPVLCAQCHYSPALDLAGAGPAGDQINKPNFSSVMHKYHGELTDGNGNPIFPPAGPVNVSCYQCHPGNITQCQRGAMATGGMDCFDCHGGMLAVGGAFSLQPGGSIDGTNDGGTRRPWKDLPRCQACHTGDAVSYLTGANLVSDADWPFRLRQAYKTNDPSASPLLANNKHFAENPNTLFRFSKGHGGLACEACHGSTHAVWPNDDPAANDNIAATQLQGHDGTIIECGTCHGQGSLPLTTSGPHGLHNVADARWVDESHGNFYERDKASCKACHGLDLTGTPLAKTAAARSFRA
ncbi:MAG: hypothetical protein WCE56_13145, partial [Desulfobacterales bacterium]